MSKSFGAAIGSIVSKVAGLIAVAAFGAAIGSIAWQAAGIIAGPAATLGGVAIMAIPAIVAIVAIVAISYNPAANSQPA